MPVYVIDTLKPKNGLDFPVVEAADVAVEGYSSLADAVTHFATDAAISALTAALEGKADKTTTDDLQAQIDQIVISASAESVVAPEVAAARVGADGTSYQTLKARLDTESEAHTTIEDKLTTSVQSLIGKEEKDFHVSDRDGSFYFWQYKIKQGKQYTISNIGEYSANGVYLRAEKYVTPSIQTVTTYFPAGSSVDFTAEHDAEWIVINSGIEDDETLSVMIEEKDAIIPELESSVHTATTLSIDNARMIRQFVSVDTSLDVADFEYGYHVIYGDSLYESSTRITFKNPATRYEFNTKITPGTDVRIYITKEGESSSSSWTSNPITIPAGVGCCITLKYSDDREITSISDLVALYTITNDFTSEIESLKEAASQTPIIEDDVEAVKTEINEIDRKLSDFVEIVPAHFNALDFILGGRSKYGSIPTVSTTRATYDPAIYHTTGRMSISPKPTSKIYVYRENGTKIEWTSDPIILEGDSNYSIVIAYVDDREITDISELTELFDIINEFDLAVAEIKAAVNKIDQMQLDEYAGKKISILGDSISTFGGSASDDPSERISDGTYTYEGNRCRYPQTNLLLDVNDTYWMHMINRFGMVLGINESWAGSRVSWDGTTEAQDVGADKHIASATRIGHLGENGTPDIILVNAGTNDIGAGVTVGTFNYDNPMNYTEEEIAALPVATFADAYRTMLIRLQKWFPTSRIVVLLPNFTSSYYTPQKADQYCEIIKEACDYFGVKWIDMRSSGITMFNRATYLPDGIHYNASGMSIVAKNVEKFMSFSFTV